MSFKVVEEFENKIAEFYGAKYAVATDSCTHAIELCLRADKDPARFMFLPARTYISIPFTLMKLGQEFAFDDYAWEDYYWIGNTNIIDAAVLWERNSYKNGTLMCLSFQFQKHLSLGRGGMILTNNKKVAEKLKRMSYDGREPTTPWRDQDISEVGYHYYMTPEVAQDGLDKLPEAIERTPRQWVVTDWPNLTNMTVFKK